MPTIYTGTQINDTATYVFKAAAEIADPRSKAIVVTSSGAAVATGATAPIMGIGLITNDFPIAAGEDVHVQIKEIGYIEAGGTITAGAVVTADSNGKAVVATSGNVLGIAMAAGVAGDKVPVQIAKYAIAAE